MHSTNVETTVSMDPSGNGSRSAGASTSAPDGCCGQPLRKAGDASRRLVRPGPVRRGRRGSAAGSDRCRRRSRPCSRARSPSSSWRCARSSCPLADPQEGVVVRPRKRAPKLPSPPMDSTCVMSVSTTATIRSATVAAHRPPGPSARRWPVRVIGLRAGPGAASATAAVREPRPSLWRMFATWRCTV